MLKNRVEMMFDEVKWFFQRLFRSHHCADIDLWGMDSCLAKTILPKLKAFRRQPFHGYPSCFCEYEENCGMTKEEYDAAKTKGDIIGGEMPKWLETIDKMIFALEFILIDQGTNKKLMKKFKRVYGDWEAEIPENKQVINWYESKKDDSVTTDETAGKLYNMKLYDDLRLKCQEGLDLFGKNFNSLWD